MKLPTNKGGQRHLKYQRMFAELRLPNLLQRQAMTHPSAPGAFKGVLHWKRMAKQLPRLEAELTVWEDTHPEQYRALPWYEAREAFRAQKARGEVVWPEWWELAGAAFRTEHYMGRAALRDAVWKK